jgi:hypothetical protein
MAVNGKDTRRPVVVGASKRRLANPRLREHLLSMKRITSWLSVGAVALLLHGCATTAPTTRNDGTGGSGTNETTDSPTRSWGATDVMDSPTDSNTASEGTGKKRKPKAGEVSHPATSSDGK